MLLAGALAHCAAHFAPPVEPKIDGATNYAFPTMQNIWTKDCGWPSVSKISSAKNCSTYMMVTHGRFCNPIFIVSRFSINFRVKKHKTKRFSVFLIKSIKRKDCNQLSLIMHSTVWMWNKQYQWTSCDNFHSHRRFHRGANGESGEFQTPPVMYGMSFR